MNTFLAPKGSVATSEKAPASARGGKSATPESGAYRGAETKDAFGEQGRRCGVRNRCEIKGDRGQLHQSRGDEVCTRCCTFVGKRALSQICLVLSMQVFSAAAPPRDQHPLPSAPEGGRRVRVDQLEPGHQLRGAEEPRRPTADADGEETAARAAGGGGRAGRRYAADRRREEQTSRAGPWIRRVLVLDQASPNLPCLLTSLTMYFRALLMLLMQMEYF